MSRLTFRNYFAETHLFSRRLFLAMLLVLACVGALIGRLYYLQVVQRSLYTTLSNANQFSLVPLEPNRGLIYDRNGVLLADNMTVYGLDVVPERSQHLESDLKAIGQLITITPEDMHQFRRASRQRRSREGVPLKLNLTEDEVARFYLNQYRFPGFRVTARLMRYYPLGDTMVSALGYVARINEDELSKLDPVNYAGTDYIGKLGIEKFYESRLHGKVGYQQMETDANGHVVRILKQIPPVAGDNLYLSLDSGLQKAAEEALGDDQGAVVAIEPKTGQVLAFVSNPRYDPNAFVRGVSSKEYRVLQSDPQKPLYNRPLRGLYPPGSTIKPFLGLQGLESGLITPSFAIYDSGVFTMPGVSHVFKDWNWRRGGHGRVDLHKAIVESCDVYYYTLASRMGIGRLHNMEARFGLGQKTGLDVDEELKGVAPSPAWKRAALGQSWYGGDTVNAGIGQGYTLVTPLQMASAVATMANRGVGFQPHFLQRWQTLDGRFEQPAPVPQSPVVLKNGHNWDLIHEAMQDVVDSARGTAYRGMRKNGPLTYTAAGKTGTAQVFRPKSYGDEDSSAIPKKYRSHAWFISFAPVENPKIALAVLVENHPHQGPVVARKVLDYYLLPDHGVKAASDSSVDPSEEDPDGGDG